MISLKRAKIFLILVTGLANNIRDFSSYMAACDVSVTFSCLIVNMRRYWLYGELFADAELDAANRIL
jgi:hypothetical protein